MSVNARIISSQDLAAGGFQGKDYFRLTQSILNIAPAVNDNGTTLAAKFQAAIDAMPNAGGTIVVPVGDWSALDPSNLTVPLVDIGTGRQQRKQITWRADGAVLPFGMPGMVMRCGQHREWGDKAGDPPRSGRYGDAFLHLRADKMDPRGQNQQDAVLLVEAHVGKDDSGLDNESIGYKFDMVSEAVDPNSACRGIRGTVTGQGGAAKLRIGRLYGVGKDGHAGILTGLMVGIRRVGTVPVAFGGDGTAQWTQNGSAYYGSSIDFAFVGQTGEGVRGAFLAQAFSVGGDTPQTAFAMGYGEQAIRPTIAAVDLHAGGSGDVLRVMENEYGGAKIAAIRKDGTYYARNFRSTEAGIGIAANAVLTIVPPANSGLFKFWTVNAQNLFGEVYFRASDGALNLGYKGSLVDLLPATTPGGTTGLDNRITIAAAGGAIYIENRSGGPRTIGFAFFCA